MAASSPATGGELMVRLIDVSLSGAAFNTDLSFEKGDAILLNKTPAKHRPHLRSRRRLRIQPAAGSRTPSKSDRPTRLQHLKARPTAGPFAFVASRAPSSGHLAGEMTHRQNRAEKMNEDQPFQFHNLYC
jgi:hypothetical protein